MEKAERNGFETGNLAGTLGSAATKSQCIDNI